jgi:hypothetical protein
LGFRSVNNGREQQERDAQRKWEFSHRLHCLHR